jgi:transcriptional regulator with XRE-family HTH domain
MAVTARRNDLARVVNERIAALRAKSLQEIADRCVPPVQMPYLSKVANGLIKRPDEEKLRGIAVGLGLPLRTLQEAMLRPPRPAGAGQPDLPAPFLSAFSRAQTHLTTAELEALYASVTALADLVTRARAEAELGPTQDPEYSDAPAP